MRVKNEKLAGKTVSKNNFFNVSFTQIRLRLLTLLNCLIYFSFSKIWYIRINCDAGKKTV